MKHIIKYAKYNNFHKILAYINTINRLSQSIKIVDSIKLSKNIHKTMLVYNNLPLHIIVSY